MFYVCACGSKFNEALEGVCEHMLEEHLDLIEDRFDDLLERIDEESLVGDDDLYDYAVEEITEEMLDEVEE